MTEHTEVVFLGSNDAGDRVYDWLCERETVFVQALLTTKDQLEQVERLQPEYIVSCGYRHIVPEAVLSVPEEGCFNLHPSYLPYNRGANPNVWSIVEETPAGVTLHRMAPAVDSGDIIARREVETSFEDTGKDLYDRLTDAQVDLFKETWPEVEAGDISPTPQDDEGGTYHRTDDFEELCELDPEAKVSVEDFLNRLRALTFPPYDNARIEIDGETYYVDVDIYRE